MPNVRVTHGGHPILTLSMPHLKEKLKAEKGGMFNLPPRDIEHLKQAGFEVSAEKTIKELAEEARAKNAEELEAKNAEIAQAEAALEAEADKDKKKELKAALEALKAEAAKIAKRK